nr:circularly permuted type 2 ATP-grasp protein [Aestuariivirga litoralis]
MLEHYRALDGTPDELIGPEGQIRPAWAPLIAALESMTPADLAHRISRGTRYLRDAGVFYRRYGTYDSTEREWPLSAMPVVIDEDEWAGISQGLTERANLLEQVVSDLYGANTLVANGHLPANLVADNPEWLRPLVGVKPRGGNFLHFLAFDIGRGPQGQWWVLGDRTQAPSGSGFALENRIATSRIYSEIFTGSHVHRLAGFFRTFRDTLLGLRAEEDSRVGILTPGPMNDTYYEHAYIARYLGLMLLEGEDLVVREGRLMIRTVAGLHPVSVLWRRLDAAWVDPLELDENSHLGTPGFLESVRQGSVTLVNALGSGILETRAFLAFLPRISQVLAGKPLALPNVATWWCGQEAERNYVKANADRMTLGNAFATRLLFDFDDMRTAKDTVAASLHDQMSGFVDRGAGNLVAQEVVTLSTAPAFKDGKLSPHPMSLRVYLARNADGWQVMPGGFARIGRAGGTPSLNIQNGGAAADVWIVSKKPVRAETLQESSTAPFARQQQAILPSRAADNLFWMGRYVERAENMMRMLRAFHLRLAEAGTTETPLLEHIAEHLEWLGAESETGISSGVAQTLASATGAASRIRDRLSVDGWNALADLSKTVGQLAKTAKPGDDMARAMGVLLRKITGFSGLVQDNMYRSQGMRFLSVGRSLERASGLASLLADFADPKAVEGCLDLAVEVADSVMTHRQRYAVATNRATVVDLLALDPLNPRSILYQLNQISEHTSHLPGADPESPLTPLQGAILQVRTSLSVAKPESIDTEFLSGIADEMARLSDLLTSAYLR